MPAYAHTHPDHPNPAHAEKYWEPLFTPFGEGPECCQRDHCRKCETLEPYHGHLNKVAFWTARFAEEMFAPDSAEAKSAHDWGYLAGLWHDLGKFAPEWQTYLASKADPHVSESDGTPSKKEDHSTAGAEFTNHLSPCGPLLSYLIAGHHAGLADGSYLFHDRLKRTINEWKSHALAAGVPLDEKIPFPPLTRREAGNDAMAFMLRYLFSSLVDADFLATEAFMQSARASLRALWPNDIIAQMIDMLDKHMARSFENAAITPVNQARATASGAEEKHDTKRSSRAL